MWLYIWSVRLGHRMLHQSAQSVLVPKCNAGQVAATQPRSALALIRRQTPDQPMALRQRSCPAEFLTNEAPA